ncbi:MAG: ribulose-phosphate 3-epimerase [Bacillota bacterium]
MKKIVLASVLAMDFGYGQESLQILENAGITHVHMDVMDGVFVPNLSLGIPVLQSLRQHTKMFYDVHLMILNPEKFIDAVYDTGAESITFHYEATTKAEEVIRAIKNRGADAGISIKPDTPITEIVPLLPLVDLVLVMTVEPGFGGQSFVEEQLEKVRFLKEWQKENEKSFHIQVDGGINLENARTCFEAGADQLVVGSALFVHDKMEERAKEFIAICKEYER